MDLRILVNGKPIKKYHDKNGNIWVEARKGIEFEIELKNDSWNNLLGIVSVDGLNVINAKHLPISESNGYIVHAKNNIVIPGWKVSKDKVKKFTFTTQENSYSKKIGADESNIGIIAACFIEEIKSEMTRTEVCDFSWDCSHDNHCYYPANTVVYSASCIPQSSFVGINLCNTGESKMLNEEIAVGSSEKINFTTHKKGFKREKEIKTIKIYYDTKENLETKGIIKNNIGIPQPFIEENDYCPDV